MVEEPGGDGVEQVVTIAVRDGRIDGIYAVLNPDKLGHLSRPA